MQIVDLIASYGAWAWIVAGRGSPRRSSSRCRAVSSSGSASPAIVTGLAAMFQPSLAWPFQFLIFGGLSLVTIIGWLR